MSIVRAFIVEALDAIEADPELAARVRTLFAPAVPADEWIPLRNAGVSVRTLRVAIKANELPASKIGREYRVRRDALTAWVAGRRVEPTKSEQTPAERAIARAANAGKLRIVGGATR